MLQAAILTCNQIASIGQLSKLPKSGLILGCPLCSLLSRILPWGGLQLFGRKHFVELLAVASKTEKKSTRHCLLRKLLLILDQSLRRNNVDDERPDLQMPEPPLQLRNHSDSTVDRRLLNSSMLLWGYNEKAILTPRVTRVAF